MSAGLANEDDFNLYAYTRNDPVNLIDSTGRRPIRPALLSGERLKPNSARILASMLSPSTTAAIRIVTFSQTSTAGSMCVISVPQHQ